MEHLLNDYDDLPNQHENSTKLCDETGHPVFDFGKKSMETETKIWSE